MTAQEAIGKQDQDEQDGLGDRAGPRHHVQDVVGRRSVRGSAALHLQGEEQQTKREQTGLRYIRQCAAGTARWVEPSTRPEIRSRVCYDGSCGSFRAPEGLPDFRLTFPVTCCVISASGTSPSSSRSRWTSTPA